MYHDQPWFLLRGPYGNGRYTTRYWHSMAAIQGRDEPYEAASGRWWHQTQSGLRLVARHGRIEDSSA